MSSLYVIRGKDQGKRFELTLDHATVGRDRSNWIQLHDTEVSRKHAELRRSGNSFSIHDLESSNGTFVNSQPVAKHLLKSGDRVQIGDSVMIFTNSSISPPRNLSELIDITHSRASETRIVSSVATNSPSANLENREGDTSWQDHSRRSLQIMYQTALAASHTLDIDELLERILTMIFESVQADRGCVMLLDPETEELVPRVTSQRNPDGPPELLQISHTILDYVLTNRRGVLTSDAGHDSRWDPAVSILKMGVREAICVPMQGRYGIVGVIYIDTFIPPGQYVESKGKPKFNEDHLQLMVGIAHQAALAVEDTTYYSAMIRSERLAAMGQTIAMLSHHIKNILQGIQGGSYLIKEGLKNNDTEVVSNGWRMVEKNQDRISHLVMDMLSYSKEREPHLALHDVNTIANDVVELMQSRAKEAKVKLNWQPDASLPEVVCDCEAIHRAVLNVVTNAIDACEGRDSGEVTIRVELDSVLANMMISIADNGVGINPADLQKIFSLFESDKGSRGTGLGLAVSQKIMREHGGDIKVSSEPGVGARFSLILPIHPQNEMTDCEQTNRN